MEIRRATQDDVAGMNACLTGYTNPYAAAELVPCALVADQSGLVLGFVASIENEIVALYVRAVARSEGVGSQLLEREEGRVRARGAAFVRLKVDSADSNALRFYMARHQYQRVSPPTGSTTRLVKAL